MAPELRGLLREYAYATEDNGPGQVTVEYLDVYQRHREAEQLGVDEPGMVLLLARGNHTELAIGDLYHMVKGRPPGVPGRAGPDLEHPGDFQRGAEEDLFSGRPRGAPARRRRRDDRPFPRPRLPEGPRLRREAARPERREAGANRRLAPRRRVAPELLRAPSRPSSCGSTLRDRAGRLILFLAPTSTTNVPRPFGLEALLADWCVIADNDHIYDKDPESTTEDDDLIIRAFTPHPVTQTLLSLPAPSLRIGPAAASGRNAAAAAGRGLQVQTLAATSPTAWGEVNNRFGGVSNYNLGVDIRPLPNADPRRPARRRRGVRARHGGRHPQLHRAPRPAARLRHRRPDRQRPLRQRRRPRHPDGRGSTGWSTAPPSSRSRRIRSSASNSRSASGN